MLISGFIQSFTQLSVTFIIQESIRTHTHTHTHTHTYFQLTTIQASFPLSPSSLLPLLFPSPSPLPPLSIHLLSGSVYRHLLCPGTDLLAPVRLPRKIPSCHVNWIFRTVTLLEFSHPALPLCGWTQTELGWENGRGRRRERERKREREREREKMYRTRNRRKWMK